MCLPFLSGMADTSLDHETIDFIKKNEGYREVPYEDKNSSWKVKPWLVCYGNMYDGEKLIDRNKTYTKSECERLIYNHFFKKIKPNLPSGLESNQKIAVSDTLYQYGHYTEITEKKIKSYPARKRWEKYQGFKLGDIY